MLVNHEELVAQPARNGGMEMAAFPPEAAARQELSPLNRNRHPPSTAVRGGYIKKSGGITSPL